MTAPATDIAAPRALGARRVEFPCLDAFRAIGATAVVATHAAFQTGRSVSGPFSAMLARLDFGVALFFVLSGFLLFHPFAQAAATGTRPPRAAGYLWRRALRILPAYWLAVAACLLLIPANEDTVTGRDWVRYLTLTQIYHLGWARYGLTQTWSLSTEAAFYLVLPVLAGVVFWRTRWAPRANLARLALLPALTIGWAVLIGMLPGAHSGLLGTWLPAFLTWFGAGMALAVVAVHLRHHSPSGQSRWRTVEHLAAAPLTCWATAFGLFVIASTPLAGPRAFEAPPDTWAVLSKNLLYTGSAVLLMLPGIFAASPGSPLVRVLASRPLRWLGAVSYGLFLWHLLVLQAVVALLHQQPFSGSWSVTFALTWVGGVLLATASYYLVERPVLSLKNRVPI